MGEIEQQQITIKIPIEKKNGSKKISSSSVHCSVGKY